MTSPDQPTVSRLRIYPLKGARGIELDTLTFDEIGPEWDRRWMVVDEKGTFVTQRTHPALTTITPTLQEKHLRLSVAGGEDQFISLCPEQESESLESGTVTVWKSSVEAVFPSPDADSWLSHVLKTPVRLAFMPKRAVRSTNPEFAPGGRVSFADGYPILLVTAAAVSRLEKKVGAPVPVERFRPNIVVENAPAHAEDLWREISIGQTRLEGVKLCARCKVVTLDQSAGERDARGEPLRTLATYRTIEKNVYFGVNMMAPAGSSVRVGDPISVDVLAAVPGNE